MNTTTHTAAGFDPRVFLDSPQGAQFWRLCDRSLIRRAEAEAIVAAVYRQVAQIQSDPGADDIAAALPDAVDDDDEHAKQRRQKLALERLRRQIARLGVDPVPTEAELREQINDGLRIGIWYDIECLRMRPLIALHDHLLLGGLDALSVLAASEQHGMVPRDPHL